ncbi:SMI1/KNR4 family protein [Thioclava sp. GXIMD4216]
MQTSIQSVVDVVDRLDPPEHRRGSLPDDNLIRRYEVATGFTFSDDYKTLLKRSSNAFVGAFDILALDREMLGAPGDLLAELGDARAVGVPSDWLPISTDNGDYYCLLEDGSVRFWSHDGATNEAWPSVAAWAAEVWVGGN